MLRFAVALLAFAGISSAVVADAPADAELPSEQASPASAAELDAWIAALDSRSVAARNAAAARLAASGRPAIEALQKAARSDSLEARVRAVSILREIYLKGDEQAADAAESTLSELVADGGASVASRASSILASNTGLSHRRALREITRLGGIVTYHEDRFNAGVVADREKTVQHIVLGKEWTGGDKGLRHLKRLASLDTVYYTPDSGISNAALDELKNAAPQLRVEQRGRSCLGVKCMAGFGDNDCRIMEVVPGSAAHNANFRVGDTILDFGGKPVRNFQDLIKHIAETAPGDKVKIQVDRNGQRVTLDTVMHEWTK